VRFNGEGFRAVKDSIDSARLKRALALTSEEMREATLTHQAVLDRKNVERRFACERFERKRQITFDAIQTLITEADRARLPAARRQEVTRAVEDLIGKYHTKEFDAVTEGIAKARRLLTAPIVPTQHSASSGHSASSHFYDGVRLEASGDLHGAICAYGECIKVNPRHIQAIARLERLTVWARGAGLGRF
jgi:hypothetical protein